MGNNNFIKKNAVLFTVFILLVSSFSVTAFAEEAKTVEDFWQTDKMIKAVYTSKAPTIDGAVGENEWNDSQSFVVSPSLADGHFLRTDKWEESEKATLGFMWDSEALYILDRRTDSFPVYDTAPIYGTSANGALPWTTDGAIFGLQPIDSLSENRMVFHFYETLADTAAGATGGMRLRVSVGDTKSYLDILIRRN